MKKEQKLIGELIHMKLRKIYGSWITFCCFAFKTKLINLFSFL